MATGVSASSAPAIKPAAGPAVLRTDADKSATDATPSSTWGSRIAKELTPNSRVLISITHSAAGGLSTVIVLAASDDPKRNAFQLCVPACAAAA